MKGDAAMLNADLSETTQAEVLGLYAQLHLQMSRQAYRISRWIEDGSGLDWAGASKDSQEEMDTARRELYAAGYLDGDGCLTAECGDVG
jgi:hypothetical protein